MTDKLASAAGLLILAIVLGLPAYGAASNLIVDAISLLGECCG